MAFKLRCMITVKYIPDFKDLYTKRIYHALQADQTARAATSGHPSLALRTAAERKSAGRGWQSISPLGADPDLELWTKGAITVANDNNGFSWHLAWIGLQNCSHPHKLSGSSQQERPPYPWVLGTIGRLEPSPALSLPCSMSLGKSLPLWTLSGKGIGLHDLACSPALIFNIITLILIFPILNEKVLSQMDVRSILAFSPYWLCNFSAPCFSIFNKGEVRNRYLTGLVWSLNQIIVADA